MNTNTKNITTIVNLDLGSYRPFAGTRTADFSLRDREISDPLATLEKLVQFVKQTPAPCRVSEALASQFAHLAYLLDTPIQFVVQHIGPSAYAGVKHPAYPQLGCALEVFNDAEYSWREIGGWLSFFNELVDETLPIMHIHIIVDGQHAEYAPLIELTPALRAETEMACL